MRKLFENFISLPYVMKIFTGASIGVGVAFTIISFIPSVPFQWFNEEYLVRDMWKSGMIAGILCIGITHTVFGVCILQKRKWTMQTIVFVPLIQPYTYQVPVIFFEKAPSFPFDRYFIISSFIWMMIFLVYVARSQKLREYYENGT